MEGEVVTPPPAPVERGWPRAAALFLASIFNPGLFAVPYLAMLAGLPVRRRRAWLMGALMALMALGAVGERTGLWWAERGWALLVGGWFVALTLSRPAAAFLPRALGALVGAGAVAGALMITRADAWATLNSQMVAVVQAASDVWSPGLKGQYPEADVAAMLKQIADVQIMLFPAVVALSTLSALGVAWWLYVWLGHDSDQGLLPLREFRFSDHLVWVIIGGLVLWLLGVKRAGINVMIFMGALYALRGAAVVSYFGVGQSFGGAAMVMIALLLLPQAVLMAILVIGLGDTWLDLRGKARAMTSVT